MSRREGFTLIELLITVTIMVVLLTFAVVSLRSNQASARDEERKNDVTVIAQQLEDYYRSGSDPSSTYKLGRYPPTDFVNSEANVLLALRDIDKRVLRAPNVGDASPISFTIAATTAVPSPDVSTYVYQPLTSTGAICQTAAQECRKFILYYKLEGIVATQTMVSKNQ